MHLVQELTNHKGPKLSQDQSQLSPDSINLQQEHVLNLVTLTLLDQGLMIVARNSVKTLSQSHLAKEELILQETLIEIQELGATILIQPIQSLEIKHQE